MSDPSSQPPGAPPAERRGRELEESFHDPPDPTPLEPPPSTHPVDVSKLLGNLPPEHLAGIDFVEIIRLQVDSEVRRLQINSEREQRQVATEHQRTVEKNREADRKRQSRHRLSLAVVAVGALLLQAAGAWWMLAENKATWDDVEDWLGVAALPFALLLGVVGSFYFPTRSGDP